MLSSSVSNRIAMRRENKKEQRRDGESIDGKKSADGGSGGYAIVTALMFFLAASTAVIAAISDAVFREVKMVRNESLSKQSYFTSESALEDTAYRIKNGKIIGSSETLNFATSTATMTITESDGIYEIISRADAGNIKRATRMILEEGTGVSFAYAIQTGIGGIDLDGGSSITGDIYTTGSIRGCGSCAVSGEAVAAGRSTSDLDQDNSSPESPGQSIVFGNTSGAQDVAQSFAIPDSLSIIKVRLNIKKTGNPSNATVKITDNNSGSPGNIVLASGTLSSSFVSTSYGWIEISLTSNPVLSAGTVYWIVVDGGHSSSNYYTVAANSSYASGQAKIGRYGNNWNNTTPAGLDAYFGIYTGTNEEGIAGEDQYNRISVGSAYSHNADYVSSGGALYCQVGSGNNKPCDTSRVDPPVENYPVDDGKIDGWKAEAATSIYDDDYSVGYAGATLGPKKIIGNLTVSGGGTLRVSGTIWVTGTISIDGGSVVRPADNTKSFVLMSDGSITLSGGADILGNTDSHILLLSLRVNDPAITINGGANDTVVFAPDGGVHISGGANVKAGAAEHISVDGGASITYDPDFSSLNFSSGLPNMGFNIKSWKEVE